MWSLWWVIWTVFAHNVYIYLRSTFYVHGLSVSLYYINFALLSSSCLFCSYYMRKFFTVNNYFLFFIPLYHESYSKSAFNQLSKSKVHPINSKQIRFLIKHTRNVDLAYLHRSPFHVCVDYEGKFTYPWWIFFLKLYWRLYDF